MGEGTDAWGDAERDVDGVLERGRRRVKHACAHIRREGVFGYERVSEARVQLCTAPSGAT
jgi:hypothetical protein